MKAHLVVAAGQHGLLTRADALKAGLSDDQLARQLAGGELVAVHQNVYRPAGAPVTRRQQLLAACMACDNAGYAARRSAAELWTVAGIVAPRPEIVVVGTRLPRLDGVDTHRTDRLEEVDVTEVDGIPITGIARTLLDLGAVLRPNRVESAIEDAVLRLGVSIAAI